MKYPRLKKELWRSVKLQDTDKEEIVSLYAQGFERQCIAEEYGVSYATVYAITCADDVKLRIEKQKKKNDAKKLDRMRSDTTYKKKRNEIISNSKKYRRKVNPEFGKFEWASTKKALCHDKEHGMR